jgi:large subunit ribosomal protein L23
MDVLISPLITEKSMIDAGAGKFTFRVAKSATKTDIKKAIEKNFPVHVTHISTSILKGKSIRTGIRRTQRPISATKKAVVTLKKGEKIGMFELGGDDKK